MRSRLTLARRACASSRRWLVAIVMDGWGWDWVEPAGSWQAGGRGVGPHKAAAGGSRREAEGAVAAHLPSGGGHRLCAPGWPPTCSVGSCRGGKQRRRRRRRR
jgi:hypothetical protein